MQKYIDAEKFIEHISGNLSWNGEQYNAASVISDLKIFPVADVEAVRHGYYIGTEFDGYADGNPVYYEWKCSECDCVFEDDEPKYRYCPNCGAKMDGESPKEELVNEITPEMIEAAERTEKRIKERVDRIYDELIAEKRAEIERLKAEIAKMPPFDAEKLAANPIVSPKECIV